MNPFIAETLARALQCLRLLAAVLIACSTAAIFASPAIAQHAYTTPEAAADTFMDALKRNDVDAMKIVLGASWRQFIPTQDREDIDAFIAAWDQSHHIEAVSPGFTMIAVGEQHWTLPVPIVRRTAGWQFDARAGGEEMRTRRIGRNELAAMQAALAYFDAQKEYASVDRTGAGVLHYAQQFWSSPGKRDGLYWPAESDDEESPLGPLFVGRKPGEGYNGYGFKILTAQGQDAPGGAYSYIINGNMVSGFAVVAWPLKYGDSGIMSFMISHDGQLYEQDLGENSAKIAQGMTTFNPDASWRKASPPVQR